MMSALSACGVTARWHKLIRSIYNSETPLICLDQWPWLSHAKFGVDSLRTSIGKCADCVPRHWSDPSLRGYQMSGETFNRKNRRTPGPAFHQRLRHYSLQLAAVSQRLPVATVRSFRKGHFPKQFQLDLSQAGIRPGRSSGRRYVSSWSAYHSEALCNLLVSTDGVPQNALYP
jgi:hypothetical protein